VVKLVDADPRWSTSLKPRPVVGRSTDYPSRLDYDQLRIVKPIRNRLFNGVKVLSRMKRREQND